MSNLSKPNFLLMDVLSTEIETIQILDVGAMIEGEARYARMLEEGMAAVTGIEPNPKELARLLDEGRENCTWLPYFLGDGGEATFHLTRYSGCSSIYTPDPEVVDLFVSMDAGVPNGNFYVTNKETVQTKRLDDVEECPPIDFLKIDVQGAELDILRHGVETLANVSVVQVEAEFVPLYKDQPLFGDLQIFLRDQGFQFHKFIDIGGRCFKPFQIGGSPFAAMSQALWADAVFVRDFTLLSSSPTMQLLKTAAILHEVYLSYDYVLFILNELDSRNGSNLAAHYSSAIREQPALKRMYMNLKEGNTVTGRR